MNSAKLIESEIKSTAHRPSMENECFCEVCRKFKAKRLASLLNAKQLKQGRILEEAMNGTRRSSHLRWVLRRLTLPNNKVIIRGLNVFIPEIAFYQDGELSAFYMNKDMFDPSLKEFTRDKLIPTFFQKAINEKRWKYRERVLAKRGNTGKIDYKEAIVIRFVDGYEKLISESEFSLIMQKRRQDSFWNTLNSFKNFISLKKDKQGGIIVRYEQFSDIDRELYDRARVINGVLATNILEGEDQYISSSEEDGYCKSLIDKGEDQRLFVYMTYKVVYFIEKFHDTRVTKGHFQWVVDELNRPILLDAFGIKSEELIKFDWTLEDIKKRERAEEERLFYAKEIPELNPEEAKISLKIQTQMKQTFEELKDYYGLSLKEELDQEQVKNQEYFRKVYPQLEVDLNVLKLTDVPTFRRKYLKDRHKKKPLVSEFKSNMIRVLHSMTPQSKRRPLSSSSPHTPMTKARTISYKNQSTGANSGRSTMYNTMHHASMYNATVSTPFYQPNRSIYAVDF